MRNAMLNSINPSIEAYILMLLNNATTIIVGIRTHLLSIGFLSAINSSIPQDIATTDINPMGYTNSVNPTLSGINTEIAIPKSAIAAIQ